jgi:glycosyltransferase involved in cell wall biosynthesis
VTPERVGVNLLWLVPGVVGGSEEYTTRTLDGVLSVAPDDLDLVLFALRPFALAHPELSERMPTVTLPLTGRDKSVRVAAESSWLALQGKRHGVAMMHHAGGIMPAVRAVPGLLTVHDVQPLLHPENFSPAKRAFSRAVVPRSARAARLVVTPSEYGREALLSVVDIEPEQVWIVPHGIPEPPDGPGREADLTALAERYGIRPPFFLYPAITYPHKNHRVLIEAFARVAADRADASLVLTGGEAQMERELAELVADLGLGDRVFRLGRIPWPDVEALMRRARALTFPSRFEGFGAPVIEAMARGCPVVAADATALPEVVAAAGVLVDPDDQEGWAREMLALLDDEARRSRLVDAGYRRASEFSAVASADALLAAYREVLAGS